MSVEVHDVQQALVTIPNLVVGGFTFIPVRRRPPDIILVVLGTSRRCEWPLKPSFELGGDGLPLL